MPRAHGANFLRCSNIYHRLFQLYCSCPCPRRLFLHQSLNRITQALCLVSIFCLSSPGDGMTIARRIKERTMERDPQIVSVRISNSEHVILLAAPMPWLEPQNISVSCASLRHAQRNGRPRDQRGASRDVRHRSAPRKVVSAIESNSIVR